MPLFVRRRLLGQLDKNRLHTVLAAQPAWDSIIGMGMMMHRAGRLYLFQSDAVGGAYGNAGGAADAGVGARAKRSRHLPGRAALGKSYGAHPHDLLACSDAKAA